MAYNVSSGTLNHTIPYTYVAATSEGSVEVKGDVAAPGPEGGGPGPAAPAPQTLLARCVLSAARYIAGVGTIVEFSVSVRRFLRPQLPD